MSIRELHAKLFVILCGVIAFLLPVYIRWVPPFIVLLFVNWLFSVDFSGIWSRLVRNKLLLVFISLYFFYVAGMLWTTNIANGQFDLEVKLSMLVLPLIIGGSKKILLSSVKKITDSFIAGCTVAVLICFSKAAYVKLITGEENFTYMKFSYALHPSYFSMYLIFGIILLSFKMALLSQKKSILLQLVYILLISLFSITVILLSSKTGIFIMVATLLVSIGFLYFKAKLRFGSLILATIVVSGAVFFFHLIPSIGERMKNANDVITNIHKIDQTSQSSTEARVLVWEAGWSVAKKNFLFGTGTGDIKHSLMSEYESKGMTGAMTGELNVHNQFLQSLIGLGVGGLLLLLLDFILPGLHCIFEKKYLFLSFLLLTGLNFMTESMLETQAGVIFFAFFFSLLYNLSFYQEYSGQPIKTKE